ncbi:MAG: PQQ-binding-like beta-propeller repeat protein [Candidatus Bathyarchaeota archaeon]|nr:PQQ-binding-like beta-propeller repeat protein [Candidatus Bathyarchaeota archaeon]
MNKHKLLLSLLIIFLLTLSYSISVTAQNTDSSNLNGGEWASFRHDASHSGYATGGGKANSAKQLWKFGTRASVWSSPAVADGRVIVGCKDCTLYCLNASNGELIWNVTAGHEVNSSPAIYEGRVYVGSDDGWVYCIDIATGSPAWIVEVGGYVRSSPAVLDDRVYVGSGLHDFFCLNASNGNLIWKFPTSQRIFSSPAIAGGVVFFASDDFCVYAVNATNGKQIWCVHTGSNENSPSVSNGLVYVGSYEGYVWALNASTGAKVWKYATQDTVRTSPAIAYGYVYVGSEDCSVYCLNASTGKKVWQAATGYMVMSSPTVSDGNVFVGSEDYNIYCIDAFSGAKKWTFATKSNVDSSPAIVNGTLYVGSHDYHVYALTLSDSPAEPTQFKPNMALGGIIIFDVLACIAFILITYTVVRMVRFSRLTRKQNSSVSNVPAKSWFITNINILCIITIAIFTVIFFLSLNAGPLWAADEKTYSQMAYHMIKSGDYLLPWSFGEPAIWAGKPPLLMWLMALSYQLFGVSNFATRFWNPLFGALSLVVIFFLGKRLYNRQVGFLSIIVLGTFTTFYAFATHAMTDGPLLFFMLASIYLLLIDEEKEGTSRYAVVSGVFFGLALMTKQIQALLIPIILIIYFSVAKRNIRFLFTKRFMLFWAAALLIFLPYVFYMALRFKDFWECYFIYCVFSRAVTPLEGHVGSYLFYFNYLVTGENLLWVGLLPFAGALSVFRAFMRRSKADMLLVIWVAVVFVVFSFAQTKIYWYILPAMPAFALAISSFLQWVATKFPLRLKRGRLCLSDSNLDKH